MNKHFRKQWFCERILNYLEESDPKLLSKPLNLDGNEEENEFDAFLDADDESDDISRRILTVYKTFHSTVIEEEVALDEEAQRQRSALLLQQDEKKKEKKIKSKKKGKKVAGKTETDSRDVIFDEDIDAEDDGSGSKKKRKGHKKAGRSSPCTMMDNLQQDDSSDKTSASLFEPVKKTVQKVVELAQIQCVFGGIDKNKLESTNYYVYFIKKKNGRVPKFSSMAEANAKMPSYFHIGSLGTDILNDMKIILDTVFVPILQKQGLISEIVPSVEDNLQKLIEVTCNSCDENSISRSKPSHNFVKFKYCNSDRAHLESPLSEAIVESCETNSRFKNVDFDFTEELTFLTRTLEWTVEELKSQSLSSMWVPQGIDNLFHQADNDDNDATSKQAIFDSLNLWTQSLDTFISDVLESFNFSLDLKKITPKENLLTEFNFWRGTEMKISEVNDTLAGKEVKSIMTELQKNSDYVTIYEVVEAKKVILNRLQEEAAENAEILRTFRTFFETFIKGDFDSIAKIIPRFIQSLKSVWMLSKYYSEEKNMLRLLRNTKSTLRDRVKSEFEVTLLFRCEWNDLKTKLETARNMLQIWKSSYLATRHEIESNEDFFIRRWEFDKLILFSETDYITSVLQDIMDVLKVVKQFQNLFEMSGLADIPECRNECKKLQMKLKNLTSPIEKSDFDIYLEIFRDEWLEILELFSQNKVEMDQHLKILIIKTFSQIKAFEASVETVEKISSIETRPTIHDSLPYMCNKIILYFMKQVNMFEQSFERHKQNQSPNTYKICDTIFWAEHVLEDLIQQKDEINSMMDIVQISVSVFNEAMETCNELELKIRNYIETSIKSWNSRAALLMRETLTETIVDVEEVGLNQSSGSKFVEDESYPQYIGSDKVTSLGALNWIMKAKLASKSKKQAEVIPKKKIEKKFLESASELLFMERGYRFKLKIQQDVFHVIDHFYNLHSKRPVSSTKSSSTLKFTIASMKTNIEKVQTALTKYNKFLGDLAPNRIPLLRQYFLEMERIIQPGMTHLTWKYSGIDDYCQKINQKCEQIVFLNQQMNKIFEKLDSLVMSIGNINFFPIEDILPTDITYEKFMENLDSVKREKIDVCLKYYSVLTRTLIQLESLVLRTHCGKSPFMTDHYKYYRNKIFEMLKESILRSIQNLDKLFGGHFSVHFHVQCYLEKNAIKIKPSCHELFAAIKITVIQFFIELRCLRFWLPDSAIVNQDPTAINAIIVDEISSDEQIKLSCIAVLDSLQKLCDGLTSSLTRWFKYSILWQYNKESTVVLFASAERPDLNRYETVYNLYADMASKIDEESPVLSICCVNVNAEMLISQLKEHCQEWKAQLSAQLAEDTMKMIRTIDERIVKWNQSLDNDIMNIDDLTDIFVTINEIRDSEIDLDILFYKIEEHHHELQIQNFSVDANFVQSFETLKCTWKILLETRLYEKFMLDPMRELAIPVIRSQIDQFVIACRALNEDYRTELSAMECLSFEGRLRWIMKFTNRHSKLENERRQLQRRSDCYEIVFPKIDEFTEVSKSLDELKREYRIED